MALCISGFTTVFRLLVLFGIIVATLFFMAAEFFAVPMMIGIAAATVFLYGLTDFFLSYILSFACNCDQHRS